MMAGTQRQPEDGEQILVRMATQTFDSEEKAQLWLSRSNWVFDNKSPLDYVRQGGSIDVVIEEWEHINHGIPAFNPTLSRTIMS